jgi:hypothetical protein
MPLPKKSRKEHLEAKAAHMRRFRWHQAELSGGEGASAAVGVDKAVEIAARTAAAVEQPDVTAVVNNRIQRAYEVTFLCSGVAVALHHQTLLFDCCR